MITLIAIALSIIIFAICLFIIPTENNDLKRAPFAGLTVICFLMAWLSMQYFSIYLGVALIIVVSIGFSYVFYHSIVFDEESTDTGLDVAMVQPIYEHLHVQSLRKKPESSTVVFEEINHLKETDIQLSEAIEDKPLDMLYAELLNEEGKDHGE